MKLHLLHVARGLCFLVYRDRLRLLSFTPAVGKIGTSEPHPRLKLDFSKIRERVAAPLLGFI